MIDNVGLFTGGLDEGMMIDNVGLLQVGWMRV